MIKTLNQNNTLSRQIKGAKQFIILLICFSLFALLSITIVSASRLPTVGGDSETWGTVLNEYLGRLEWENATELNDTMVNGTNGEIKIGI